MSKPFLFLSVNHSESLLPLSASGHIPSLLKSFSVCLLPLCNCSFLISVFAYALNSPPYTILFSPPLFMIFLPFSVGLFCLLCLEGIVGISLGFCWTMHVSHVPVTEQADGLQITVAASKMCFSLQISLHYLWLHFVRQCYLNSLAYILHISLF